MKRIFFNKEGRVGKPFFPFWQPWGCLGCLWRVIVFLLGLLLLAFLFSMLTKGCSGEKKSWGEDEIYVPSDSIPAALIDTTKVRGWNDEIPGTRELPRKDENYIPPIDSSLIVPNPVDSLGQIVADQIIVFFNSRKLSEDMTSFAQQFKTAYPQSEYRVAYYNPTAGTMLLQVPQERVVQLLDEIPQKVIGIDYKLTTNAVMGLKVVPNDPGFKVEKYAAYFRHIQAFDAWDITMGSSDVKVAIVDSYFCLEHPELNSRWEEPIHIPSKTRNVLPRNGSRMDIASHGSHVAGIAIGSINNSSGTSGIAPNCQWIPISLGEEMTFLNIMEGVLYGIYKGADVVNLSIGMRFPEDMDKSLSVAEQAKLSRETFKALEDVWEYVYKVATDRRCVIVTSAGNENLLMALDPGKRCTGIVKVEAVDRELKRADFSNFGILPSENIDCSTVSAPGVDILSSVVHGKYMEFPGTSMSSPFVAGAVALMKSIDKMLTADEVIDILKKTGKPLEGERIGPLIQIKDALLEVKKGLLSFDDVVKDPSKL